MSPVFLLGLRHFLYGQRVSWIQMVGCMLALLSIALFLVFDDSKKGVKQQQDFGYDIVLAILVSMMMVLFKWTK